MEKLVQRSDFSTDNTIFSDQLSFKFEDCLY